MAKKKGCLPCVAYYWNHCHEREIRHSAECAWPCQVWKELQKKERMMAINDPRQLILTKAPEFNTPWPDELRGSFDWREGNDTG